MDQLNKVSLKLAAAQSNSLTGIVSITRFIFIFFVIIDTLL